VITFSKTSQKVLARAVQEAGTAEKLALCATPLPPFEITAVDFTYSTSSADNT